MALTQVFLPQLKSHSHAFILNVGSLASFIPIPNKSVYAATKSFVYAFSSALRVELRNTRVSVSCLAPGATITNAAVQERVSKALPKSGMLRQTPAEVASVAIAQLLKGNRLIIPGWHNKLTFFLWSVLPRVIAERVVVSIFDKTIPAIEQGPVPRASWSLALRQT